MNRVGKAVSPLARLNTQRTQGLFNLAHNEFMNVLDLADIVEELRLKGVRNRTTGGERGWLGDSLFVHFDTAKVPSSRDLAEQPKSVLRGYP